MSVIIEINKKIKRKFRVTKKDTHECLFCAGGSYFFKRKPDDCRNAVLINGIEIFRVCYPPKYILHFNGIFENCKKYSCAEALKGLEKIKEHIDPEVFAECRSILEQYKYTQLKEVFFIADW